VTRAGAVGLGLAILVVLTLAQAEGGPPSEPRRAASLLDELGPFVTRSTTPAVGGWYDGPLGGSSESSARATACGTYTLAVGDAEQTSVRLLYAGAGRSAEARDLAISLTTVRVAAGAAATTPALHHRDSRTFRSAEAAAARALGASGGGPGAGEAHLTTLMRSMAGIRELCD
jgi:hypothetical protein